jgi:hypothetical protein
LPEVPKPEPARGHSHFTTATFDPCAIGDNWTPCHAEDGPAKLKFKDVCFHGRYDDIRPALRWVLAFNRPRFEEHARPSEWATLAFMEGANETLHLDFARCVTPLRYHCHELPTPPRWTPANLLDLPSEYWTDEPCSSPKRTHDTLDKAVCAAIEANRKFRPGMKKRAAGRKSGPSYWPSRPTRCTGATFFIARVGRAASLSWSRAGFTWSM